MGSSGKRHPCPFEEPVTHCILAVAQYEHVGGSEADFHVMRYSVPSSKWGEYKGTLVGVSHLDLINWTNRVKWLFWSLTGTKRKFNGVAFYLDIADMLAKEGL